MRHDYHSCIGQIWNQFKNMYIYKLEAIVYLVKKLVCKMDISIWKPCKIYVWRVRIMIPVNTEFY